MAQLGGQSARSLSDKRFRHFAIMQDQAYMLLEQVRKQSLNCPKMSFTMSGLEKVSRIRFHAEVVVYRYARYLPLAAS